MNIDYSKVKRLFVFGCSFTNYKWPTWADVLSKSIPNAEYYNFGHRGLGNLFIASRLSEISARYKFNENDLVIVMWTSIVREDRYLKDRWIGSGNIYNQKIYPESFVKEFADINFYLIRDHALINLSMGYLKSLACQSLNLFSFSLTNIEGYEIQEKNFSSQCNELYNFNIDDKKILINYFANNKNDKNYHTYDTMTSGVRTDGHPTTYAYYEYLNYLGFNLTEASKQYAIDCTKKANTVKKDIEFVKVFPELVYHKKNLIHF